MKHRGFPDVVGAALGLYGPAYGPAYGPGPATGALGPYGGAYVTGADEMALPPGPPAGWPWPYGCALPEAMLDPRLPNRELKSVMVGGQCGPLEIETVIPFENGNVTLASGATVTLVARANVDMKPIGLKIPSSQASSVNVIANGAIVGIQPMFPAAGEMNGQAFQENATGNLLNCPTAQIGQTISVPFRNVSPQDIQFFAPSLRVVCTYYGNRHIYGGPQF